MTLSSMIVRETGENQFVIGMVLTSGAAEPSKDIFENMSLQTVAIELPTDAVARPDLELRMKVRYFLPN